MSNHASDSLANRVVLRDVRDDDLPIFFEYQRDPESNEMAAFPPRDRDSFMAHWRKILADHTLIKQTITVDGAVAGDIGSFELDGQREVSYWIGRSYWGKGVVSAALAAFLAQVKARPLYAHVVKHNVASRRVLEKCGFTICGEATGEDGVDEWILKLDTSHNQQAH